MMFIHVSYSFQVSIPAPVLLGALFWFEKAWEDESMVPATLIFCFKMMIIQNHGTHLLTKFTQVSHYARSTNRSIWRVWLDSLALGCNVPPLHHSSYHMELAARHID